MHPGPPLVQIPVRQMSFWLQITRHKKTICGLGWISGGVAEAGVGGAPTGHFCTFWCSKLCLLAVLLCPLSAFTCKLHRSLHHRKQAVFGVRVLFGPLRSQPLRSCVDLATMLCIEVHYSRSIVREGCKQAGSSQGCAQKSLQET